MYLYITAYDVPLSNNDMLRSERGQPGAPPRCPRPSPPAPRWAAMRARRARGRLPIVDRKANRLTKVRRATPRSPTSYGEPTRKADLARRSCRQTSSPFLSTRPSQRLPHSFRLVLQASTQRTRASSATPSSSFTLPPPSPLCHQVNSKKMSPERCTRPSST